MVARLFVRWSLLVPILALLFCAADVSWGQKKKGAPPPATGAPTLDFPLPLGVQRGVPLDLILTGTNLFPAAQLWTTIPGTWAIVADETLANEGKVKVRVEVPADAPLGLYPIRLASEAGLSNLRLFAVDDLPQVVDNGANRDLAKAQPVKTPCVVAGRLEPEQSDFYKIAVKAGERLSFEVLGRRLGSPVDPCLSLYGGKVIRELAHDNDSPGCQSDPRLSYTFKEAGEYLVEVRDVLGRGGAEFVYRLRIGDFPLATAPIPMAAKAGSKVSVQFAGPLVDGVKPLDVAVPNAPAGSVVWVSPRAGGAAGWPVPLIISDVDEIVEKEPNSNPKEATRLPVPGGATGRFASGDSVDVYVISLKKGEKTSIEAQTLEWGSPTPVYLSVRNPKGVEVAKSDPKLATPLDQRIELTPAEDGDFTVEVQHLLFQSGPAEAYHLSVRPAAAFEVVLAVDKAEAAAGAIAALPFNVVRKNNTGPIEVRAVGIDAQVAKVGGTQTGGILLLPSKSGDGIGARTISVEARGSVNGKPVVVLAHARPSLAKALADLPFPPIDGASTIAVGSKGKSPFSLSAKFETDETAAGSPATLTITATRSEGFAEEIAINPPLGLPPGVGAKGTPIPKDKTQTKFNLDVGVKAPLGEHYLLITGKAKIDKRDVVSDPAVVALVVAPPFDVAGNVKEVSLVPGGKAKFTVTANRKAGFKSALTVEVTNLPAGVTGGKATIAADQSTVEIELTADEKAAPIDRVDLEISVVAAVAPNLLRSGPPISLRIGKK